MKKEKPQSILFIDHVSVIGGAERSLIDLSKVLKELGFKCSFIIPAQGELFDKLSDVGNVYCLPIHSWRWWSDYRMKLILSLPVQILGIIRFYRLIKRIDPEIIHFNINRLVEPVIAARLSGIKSVMHYRDIPSRISKRFFFGMSAFYQIMNLANVWIANSRATYNDIKGQAKVPIFHVPNGIDGNLFSARMKDDLPFQLHGGLAVLMIASLTPWKNLEEFIELAAATSKRMANVHFYIAGTGGPAYKNELEKKRRAVGVEHRLTFLNKVETIPSLLGRIDVLVHTTIQEPFGRVFVEAMLASKPVLTFRGGGADEIVDDGVTGILVEPHDVDEMRERLIVLLNDVNLRSEMGRAGLKKAMRSFSLDQHVKRVMEIYRTLV